MGIQPARVSAGLARGVDLNLDEFNLSEPTRRTREDSSLQFSAGVNISTAFWSNIDDDSKSLFNKDDKNLLKRIFNRSLSDRREESDVFTPPDGSFAYVQDLRRLVAEEEAVQRQRKQHFCSGTFVRENPGSLFSASWRPSVEILGHEAKTKRQGCRFLPRLDYKSQEHLFTEVMEKAVPVFDKSTEDGTRFRIYRLGSLEVRTTQELDAGEVIGVIFSVRALSEAPEQHGCVAENEKIVKITEYVERSGSGHCSYTVLETERGDTIVTQELQDGTVKREENPKDLEDRNSLARVLRTADCSRSGFSVGAVRGLYRGIYGHVTGTHAGFSFSKK